MSRRFYFAAVILSCCVSACSCNHASTPTGSTESGSESGSTVTASVSGNQDQSAETVLREVAKFYGDVDGLKVDLTQAVSASVQGVNDDSTNKFLVAAQRPNRLSIRDTKGELADFVSDGESLYTVLHQMKAYTKAKAPASFASLSEDRMMFNMLGMGNMIALGLLSDDPYAAMMDGVTSSEYVGQETLGDAKSHHLKFQQSAFDWEMWVAAEGDPLLHKIVFDMSKQLNLAGQGVTKMTITVLLENWRLNPTLDENTFAYEPAADIKKVNSFFEGLGGPSRGQETTSPLVGKPSPPITATMLDGSPFNLEERNAEQILMIDFWATWCGPCVMELPILMEVAEEYADRGVALYAINQGEDQETIQKFLDKQKWKLNVVVDQKGAAGGSYGVSGIPQLVIVDKTGTVQSVHVGYSPQIGDVLKRELDTLLEGKSLAAEANAEE